MTNENPPKFPFRIDLQENPAMGAWDLYLSMGGFKTRKEAKEFADLFAKILSENANAKVERVQ